MVIFFLISGFVVPFSIKSDRPILGFAVSRIFRLYPAFWVSVVLAAILLAVLVEAPGLATVIANGTMAAPLLGQHWMQGVYWTLFIELLFYVAVIGLFAFGLLYKPWAIAILGAGLALTTLAPILAPDVPLREQDIGVDLSILFSGLLLRIGLREGHRIALVLAAALFILQMVSVWVTADYSLQHDTGFATYSVMATVIAYPLAFAAFIVGALFLSADTRALGGMAAISYSFYLLHDLALPLVFHLLPSTGERQDMFQIALSLALTLAVSVLLYRVVERPFIALGRLLMERTARRPAAIRF